jgi:gamma-glutamylcyclotransferase (GGCT)/AIG2-like uncharacterized protein YtfP
MANEKVIMFLNGTAMSGQRDHHAVEKSRFLGEARTKPAYRFYAVRDEFPGLVPAPEGGTSIVGELYEMDFNIWQGSLLPSEPDELVPGWVELADGRTARVMVLELDRVRPGDRLVEISQFQGWRQYQSWLDQAQQATRPGPRAGEAPL